MGGKAAPGGRWAQRVNRRTCARGAAAAAMAAASSSAATRLLALLCVISQDWQP